jgi:Leu/Phe-tRNA-protein transferase
LSKKNLVYYLTFEDIQNRDILFNNIYMNKNTNYYISEDFSKDFYIYLAYYGFICTSTTLQDKFYLLAEIQFEYAILDFKDLHISKKIAQLIKKDKFEFSINAKFEEDINKI